jgi:branched-chain amino acid transport system permease protein
MLLLVSGLNLNYFLAILGSILLVGILGFILYHFLLRHLRQGEFERGIILTLGVGMVIQNAMIVFVGASPSVIDTEFSFMQVKFGNLQVDIQRVLAVGFTVAALSGLYLVLHHTRFGKAMRAFSQNREAALMVGMRPHTIASQAVAVGVALAGLSGAALGPVFTVHPVMGMPILFKAFAIVIIGGLGHVPGAVAAGLLIGTLESFAGGFGSISLQDAVAFIAMIFILWFKPEGLFGKGVRV